MLAVIILALIVTFPLAGAAAAHLGRRSELRVPSRIRVAELREAFRHVEPGEEITIRLAASWILSVEMIMEVAADEGFRFVRDAITSNGQFKYKAIVFVRGEHRG